MWPDTAQWLRALEAFLYAGGPVLMALLAVSLLLWALLLERCWFRWVGFPRRRRTLRGQAATDGSALHTTLNSELRIQLQGSLPVIRTLIALCPLIGLLGTVTGMIQLFDTLALNGTGNPRLLSAGVARATLPTLAGMVVAVTGLLAWNRLQRWSRYQQARLQLREHSS